MVVLCVNNTIWYKLYDSNGSDQSWVHQPKVLHWCRWNKKNTYCLALVLRNSERKGPKPSRRRCHDVPRESCGDLNLSRFQKLGVGQKKRFPKNGSTMINDDQRVSPNIGTLGTPRFYHDGTTRMGVLQSSHHSPHRHRFTKWAQPCRTGCSASDSSETH